MVNTFIPRHRSRAAFMNALMELLQIHSFAEITANEIISRSPYSRASFYRHFRDKYDLAEKMILEEAKEYAHIIGTQMLLCSTLSSQEEYIFQVALKTFQHVIENKELYEVELPIELPKIKLNLVHLKGELTKVDKKFIKEYLKKQN